jgi:hypothetical protein
MDSTNTLKIVAELNRRAEEKLGRERAQALQNDLQQMALELQVLQTYDVSFEDEP